MVSSLKAAAVAAVGAALLAGCTSQGQTPAQEIHSQVLPVVAFAQSVAQQIESANAYVEDGTAFVLRYCPSTFGFDFQGYTEVADPQVSELLQKSERLWQDVTSLHNDYCLASEWDPSWFERSRQLATRADELENDARAAYPLSPVFVTAERATDDGVSVYLHSLPSLSGLPYEVRPVGGSSLVATGAWQAAARATEKAQVMGIEGNVEWVLVVSTTAGNVGWVTLNSTDLDSDRWKALPKVKMP